MKKYKRGFSNGRESGFKKGGSKDTKRPRMYEAICDGCGDGCEIPFKPSGDRPIYCSSCYGRNQYEEPKRPGRERGFRDSRERSFGGRQPDRAKKYKTVCDQCGRECEVPFRPTAGKPIYCDQCFEQGGGKKEKGTEIWTKEFEKLHKKMDEILKTLRLVLPEKKNPEDVAEVEEETEDPKPKKKAKKTTSAKTTAKKTTSTKKKVAKLKE